MSSRAEQFWTVRGQSEDWDLFTIDIGALTVISPDGGQLVIDRWSTTDGRQTIRRSWTYGGAGGRSASRADSASRHRRRRP
jgi:hypothetical protein